MKKIVAAGLLALAICPGLAVIDLAMAQVAGGGAEGGASSEQIGAPIGSDAQYSGPGVPGLPGAPGNYGGTSRPSLPLPPRSRSLFLHHRPQGGGVLVCGGLERLSVRRLGGKGALKNLKRVVSYRNKYE